MVDAKRWLIAPALAAVAGIALTGCEASQDGEYKDFPKPGSASGSFTALFAPTAAIPVLPFPTDLFFQGTTDGTLNIPATYSPMTLTSSALNTLDGFGTAASMITRFSQPINPLTVGGTSVRLIELYLSNSTKAPAQGAELPVGVTSPVRRVLSPGADYLASVATAVDSNGQTLEITPVKPLTPSTGTTNIGYLVLITNAVQDTEGRSAEPSADYAAIKAAPADCSTITNTTLNGLCRLTKAHLAIGQAVGVNPADVVMSWSFSTQSTDDPLKALALTVPAQPIGVQATGLTTQQANPALQGKANLYVGTTVVPYYQRKPANVNDASILTSFWVSATPPPPAFFPNATAPYFITRFNPIPVAQGGNTTIPLLVTVPNGSANAANGGCTKPAAGWPVAIVQHGLGGNRTQALAMADGFADACFVVAAIDLPLHGITDTANPFYQAPNERTFNVDFVNNTTGATGPDGRIDASGTHALPTILSSPPTARDSLRQGQADIGVLTKSLANLDLTGDNVSDIDPARIHYVGLSLGGIVGAAQARYNPGVQTVTVSVPGGVISKLVLDSATFGATIRAGLLSSFSKNPASASFPDNGASFQQFFREVQTVIDPADPFNQVCACAGTKPLFLQKVRGDTVVPNNSTDRLITAANMTKLRSGVNAVTAGQPVYLTMTAGSHGSLFDPTTSLPATVEMQSQVIRFAASANQPGGPFVVIDNPAIVEQ